MALSRAQKREIMRLYGFSPDQVTVVGVGYPSGKCNPEPKPLPPPIEMVYAGKLSRAKGVPWMLRAISEVTEPSWRLHLIGGGAGPEKEETLSLAESLGDRVQVHGPLPQEKLAEIFRRSHLLILPSFYGDEEALFEERLAAAIRDQIEAVRQVPKMDPARLAPILEAYS